MQRLELSSNPSKKLSFPFPSHFVWGASTSAYQIEGSIDADGKGPQVWDDFVGRPGRIANAETGEVACDHYRLWREDVGLMREIGLQGYRMSISWSRVIPQGTGAPNPAGLDFYERLVDALLDAGIQPWVTLYHWDTPQALYDRGHWLNPDMPKWFGDYATLMAGRLGDRVKHWITLNEPQCFVQLALCEGVLAPGDKLSDRAALLAWKHALLAHGTGVDALRAAAPRPLQVGCAPTGRERIPLTESPENVAAARTAYWALDRDLWSLPMWCEPMLRGCWPEGAEKLYGAALPSLTEAEGRIIARPLDFLGYNSYSGAFVRAAADKPDGFEVLPHAPGAEQASLPWLLRYDDCLYWAARFHTERYPGMPFVITENGMSLTDFVSRDGKVHDEARIDWTAGYLRGLRRAAAEGVSLGGYFHWSLMDNFEWAEGFRARFGLIHVDFASQKRTLKESAHWYRRVIEAHGAGDVL